MKFQGIENEPSFEIRQVGFEIVLPVWHEFLWPNRKSTIRQVNNMKLGGGTDSSIEKLYSPTFFGAYLNNQIVGVNSCHQSGQSLFRSRGLYVFPAWRRRGVARALLRETCLLAKSQGAVSIWSAPREESLGPYRSVGFEPVSELTHDGFEFGPNLYVVKKLSV